MTKKVTIPFLSQMTTCFFSTLLLASLLTACTKSSNNNAGTAQAPQAELNLAIWGNYLPPEAAERFTKETGIKLNISNYSSNEELLAKVQSGSSGLDIVVPSDYMVEIMVQNKMLEPLDKTKLNVIGQIDPRLLKQSFDPENTYSVPYAWTTAGIAYNKELLPEGVKNWKTFFTDKKLAGKISVMDDVRETIGAALKYNGASVNTTNLEELKKAEKTLIEAKSRIKMFSSDTIDALTNKEVVASQSYSSDALQASVKSNGKIAYVIPEEGTTQAIDNLVILKGSKNTEAAHKLIQFILQPEMNIEFVKTVMAGPVLKETRAKLPPELQNNAGLFPSEETLTKLERVQELGDKTAAYDKVWTKVKTN